MGKVHIIKKRNISGKKRGEGKENAVWLRGVSTEREGKFGRRYAVWGHVLGGNWLGGSEGVLAQRGELAGE